MNPRPDMPPTIFGREVAALSDVATVCWFNPHFHKAMVKALLRRRRYVMTKVWRESLKQECVESAAREHITLMFEAHRADPDAPRWFEVIVDEWPPAHVYVRQGQVALVVQISGGSACYAMWRLGSLQDHNPAETIKDLQRRAQRLVIAAE